ncbi:MAG: MDR family oxidoreductase [Rhizobiaceae bacterium]
MRAVVLRKMEEVFSRDVEEITLPPTDSSGVVCALAYSSLNYKDALAITNRGPVVRRWPMVPGIDGAGVVERSSVPQFSEGTEVAVTGWGLGETRWGCLAGSVFLPREFPAALPVGLSLREAMAVGTAGLTAMLCILRIEGHGVCPQDGPVLVTGASGGVGGMALMFLKSLGYTAVASTGRVEEADYLESIGASLVIDRAQLAKPGKPLAKEEWAAVIDSVGSVTLANACAATKYGGIVAACGLAQGMDLPATVAPFILRGVTLAGIDSVMAPQDLRRAAWDRIAQVLDRAALARITREIALSDIIEAAEELLAGRVRGRLVVDVRK